MYVSLEESTGREKSQTENGSDHAQVRFLMAVMDPTMKRHDCQALGDPL